jgi:hypothetical protein
MVEGEERTGLMAAIAAVFVAFSLVATVVVINGAEYYERYPIQVGDEMVYSSHSIMFGSEVNETYIFQVTFVNETQILLGSNDAFWGLTRVSLFTNNVAPYLQFSRNELIQTPLGPRIVEHTCYSGLLNDSIQFKQELWREERPCVQDVQLPLVWLRHLLMGDRIAFQ